MIPNKFKTLFKSINDYLGSCQANLVSADKSDHSPVTVADIGVQVLVLDFLKTHYPGHTIIAEEASKGLSDVLISQAVKNLHTSGYNVDEPTFRQLLDYRGIKEGSSTWMIDPIDGTKGYLRGDQFAVAIARFSSDHQPEIGVLLCPNLPYPTLKSERKGTGLYWKTGQPVVQFYLSDPHDVMTIDLHQTAQTGFFQSVEKAHGDLSATEKIRIEMGIENVVSIDSQAKYAALVRGEGTVYIRMPRDRVYREKVWDHGAGYALLRAVDGIITDAGGRALDFSKGNEFADNLGIAATRQTDHNRLIEIIKPHLALIQ